MNSTPGVSDVEPGPFAPTWESLRTFVCPEWFRAAKLGIWAHWGPQCVPMYGDWYARHMYREGHPQYLHHWRNYGHPSRVGYKDLVKLWKAERFDPDGLMDRYQAAGARYFVAQAVHHDNFDNWPSTHNPWNATQVGPMRDIVGDWQRAARRRGLRFGVSEHLAASFTWWITNKGADKAGPYANVPYDGNDPAFENFYHDNRGAAKVTDDPWQVDPWYTDNPAWTRHWHQRIRDLIERYEPDLLYSDGPLPWDRVGLSIVAQLYNSSARRNGGINQAVYTQKNTDPGVFPIGVLDIERGQKDEVAPFAWQTDTCVGGWFYDVRQVYKKPAHVIEMWVDIVAKNGCLLLNFPQRPDGTLDEETSHILDEMAAWIRINGPGIYETVPWKVAMEGPTRTASGHFKEDRQAWTAEDFRFTSRGQSVYAFQMKYPEDRKAFIKSAARSQGVEVQGVRLLGYPGTIVHRQADEGLLVELPETQICDAIPCIEIQLA